MFHTIFLKYLCLSVGTNCKQMLLGKSGTENNKKSKKINSNIKDPFWKRDVIVQVGELPSRKVGDEFEAFIGVTFGLDVSYQGLEEEEDTTNMEICSLCPSGYRSINRALGPTLKNKQKQGGEHLSNARIPSPPSRFVTARWRTIVVGAVRVTGVGGAGLGRSGALRRRGTVVASGISVGLRVTRSGGGRGLQVVLFALLLLVTVVVFFVRRLSVGGSGTIGMETLLRRAGRSRRRRVFAGRTFLLAGRWHFAV
ncbi:hypothetical protein EYF80_049220 [Liparis tanakae]|uniref:Uncharacterized protein n=1 Tax=Liparis tanakae TaxID=230148 RepID=A0A4Z2FIK4_9TELE|nr:hypothetical protein EYF80_049220 [Liparis tanakae]